MRRDPGDQGPPRVTRRHERPPGPRDRERHDQLHPLGHGPEGGSYADALAEAQRLGYAEADPTDDVGGLDAAAKTAILATVAFGSRVPLEWVAVEGIEGVDGAARHRGSGARHALKLLGRATLADGRVDVRVGPAFVDAHHPLAAVEGAFNAVMLQGDAIREITLEGPGAGGIETASAVVADMVSVVGTTGTGFLQNDPVWRELERWRQAICRRTGTSDSRSRTARACWRASPTSSPTQQVSVARLVQQPGENGAVLHVVTHEAPRGKRCGCARHNPRDARVAR